MKRRDITTTELFEAISAFSEDVDRRFDQCATKEDLKRFATKEDLKAFATKEDLKAFATKEDLKDLKKDMRKEMQTLKIDIQKDMKSLQTDIQVTLQTEIGKVLRMFPPVIHKADSKTNAFLERMVQKRVLLRKDIEDLLAIHPLLS